MSTAYNLDPFQPFALFHDGNEVRLSDPTEIDSFDGARFELYRNTSGSWVAIATITLSAEGFTIRTEASTEPLRSDEPLSTPMWVRADLVENRFRVQFAAGEEIVEPKIPAADTPKLTWTSGSLRSSLSFSEGEAPDDKGGPLILWPGKED